MDEDIDIFLYFCIYCGVSAFSSSFENESNAVTLVKYAKFTGVLLLNYRKIRRKNSLIISKQFLVVSIVHFQSFKMTRPPASVWQGFELGEERLHSFSVHSLTRHKKAVNDNLVFGESWMRSDYSFLNWYTVQTLHGLLRRDKIFYAWN